MASRLPKLATGCNVSSSVIIKELRMPSRSMLPTCGARPPLNCWPLGSTSPAELWAGWKTWAAYPSATAWPGPRPSCLTPDTTNQEPEHGKYHIYLKLAIDGKTSKPFSAYTLPPFHGFQPQAQGSREMVIQHSRERYTANTLRKPATIEKPGSKGPNDLRPGQRALL